MAPPDRSRAGTDRGIEKLAARVSALVANDELSTAVALLLEHPQARHKRVEVTMMARRLAEAEREKDDALITDEAFAVRRNAVTASLLRLLEALGEGGVGVSDLPRPSLERLYRYGNLLLQRNDFQGAVVYFDKVLLQDPAHLASRLDRGVARCAQGLLAEAVEDLSVVLAHDINQPFARFNRGVALWSLGRNAEACADWQYVKDLGFDLADDVLRQRCRSQRATGTAARDASGG